MTQDREVRQAARMEGEPFEAYKLRRKMNQLLLKKELMPELVTPAPRKKRLGSKKRPASGG
jgi:hypothetical protein